MGATNSRSSRDTAFATRFGQNLSYCRERRSLSQEELGFSAELHRTAIGQLERGQRIARTDTLVKLVGSLAVPPEELLDGLLWTPGAWTRGTLAVEPFAIAAASPGSRAAND